MEHTKIEKIVFIIRSHSSEPLPSSSSLLLMNTNLLLVAIARDYRKDKISRTISWFKPNSS